MIRTNSESIICMANATNDLLLTSGSTGTSDKVKEWAFDGRKLEVVGSHDGSHKKPISAMAVMDNGNIVTGSLDCTISILT